jgi:hypothetical protein
MKGGTSLISNLAISLTSRPARFKAMGIAKLGAIVKSIGCVAASPQDKILAIGFAEVVLDLASVVNTSAEAPSLIADAFAAVTVPSFLSLSEDKRKNVLEGRFQSRDFIDFETFVFFVFFDFDIAFFRFHCYWRYFCGKMACFPGCFCSTVSISATL